MQTIPTGPSCCMDDPISVAGESVKACDRMTFPLEASPITIPVVTRAICDVERPAIGPKATNHCVDCSAYACEKSVPAIENTSAALQTRTPKLMRVWIVVSITSAVFARGSRPGALIARRQPPSSIGSIIICGLQPHRPINSIKGPPNEAIVVARIPSRTTASVKMCGRPGASVCRMSRQAMVSTIKKAMSMSALRALMTLLACNP